MKSEAAHPIQVAARRSGVSPDVIRAWERRYKAVKPRRTGTNRRLYTDEDIERLFLLAQVTNAGRRIGDVARLTLGQLRAMSEEDQAAAARVGVTGPARSRGRRSGPHLQTCLDAVRGLDAAALETALSKALRDLGAPALLEQLLVPLMTDIGEGWRSGSMRVAHEHIATAIVRSFLSNLERRWSTDDRAPSIVVATPAGQQHELGGLIVSVAASMGGWRVTNLGSDLPAEEIAAAVLQKDAKAVALSIVYPEDDPHLAGELKTLRQHVGDDVAMIVGGSAAPAYADAIDEVGARLLEDLTALRTELSRLRRPAPGSGG